MADTLTNYPISLVATAPSPATSGTSLVVTASEGAFFPSTAFYATVCPAGTAPTRANAEIVRVTARSTDTMTITRAAGAGTTARTIVVGDQFFQCLPAEYFLQPLIVTGGTVVVSTPVLNATQTWNDGAVGFTGIKLNVINTASAASSFLLDLQVGGSSVFTVYKSGIIVGGGLDVSAGTGSAVNTANVGIAMAGIQTIGRSPSTGALTLSTNAAEVLFASAAHIAEVRNSTTAQTFNVCRTWTDDSNKEQFRMTSAAGIMELQAITAGSGTDDLDIRFTPAGAGLVRFGTKTGTGDAAVDGYVSIKTSAGVTIKLATVA